MGLDLIELVMDLERDLQIDLSGNELSGLLGNRHDAQVRDLVTILEQQVKVQKSPFCGSAFGVARQRISQTLNIDESEITLDSWIIRDLGMD
jgi:acyl carrier protein